MNANPPGTRQKSKLLDQVRLASRAEHYSMRTEKAYVQWIKQFIPFHKQLRTPLLCSFLRFMHCVRGCLQFALDTKYPNAAQEWGWPYVFPVSSILIDPRSGKRRRHLPPIFCKAATIFEQCRNSQVTAMSTLPGSLRMCRTRTAGEFPAL